MKRLLASSRAWMGLGAIIACVAIYLGASEEQAADVADKIVALIVMIAGIWMGGTALEDAAAKRAGDSHGGKLLPCVLLMMLPLIGGCTKLDAALQRVHEDKHLADKVLVAATGKFVEGAREMAAKKHQLQERDIDTTWDLWVSTHSTNGVLTLTEAQLAEAVKRRDAAKLALALSQDGWEKYVNEFVSALARFEATSDLLAKEETEAWAARQAVQAQLQQALSALTAAAAGVGGVMVGAGL